MSKIANFALGAAVGAAALFGAQQITPSPVSPLEMVADVATMNNAPGDFQKYPLDGPNWFKKTFVSDVGDTMIMGYFPAKYAFNFEGLLLNSEARRLLSCNLVPCTTDLVSGEPDTIRVIAPVLRRSDMLYVDVYGHDTITVHRNSWDRIIGGVQ